MPQTAGSFPKWSWHRIALSGKYRASPYHQHVNTLRPGQNDRHFVNEILRRISSNGNIGYDNGLAPQRRQAIIWSNVGLICWRIYASRGFIELITTVDCIIVSYTPFWHWGSGPGLYSISGRTSCPKISLSLEAMRLGIKFLQSFYHFEIWQVLGQHCCRYTCELSEQYDQYNTQSRGFEMWLSDALSFSELGPWLQRIL